MEDHSLLGFILALHPDISEQCVNDSGEAHPGVQLLGKIQHVDEYPNVRSDAGDQHEDREARRGTCRARLDDRSQHDGRPHIEGDMKQIVVEQARGEQAKAGRAG